VCACAFGVDALILHAFLVGEDAGSIGGLSCFCSRAKGYGGDAERLGEKSWFSLGDDDLYEIQVSVVGIPRILRRIVHGDGGSVRAVGESVGCGRVLSCGLQGIARAGDGIGKLACGGDRGGIGGGLQLRLLVAEISEVNSETHDREKDEEERSGDEDERLAGFTFTFRRDSFRAAAARGICGGSTGGKEPDAVSNW
jgi:hypothetical protein